MSSTYSKWQSRGFIAADVRITADAFMTVWRDGEQYVAVNTDDVETARAGSLEALKRALYDCYLDLHQFDATYITIQTGE